MTNNTKSKKILAGFLIDGKGGVDNYLLNFLEAIHGDGIQVDFLTNQVDVRLQEQLREYESRLFPVARLWHPFQQYRQVKELIEREQYDIVYLNISTALQFVSMAAAKKCKVPRRMLHSHSSGNDCESAGKRKLYNILHYICKQILYRLGNEYYACSKSAGYWMYPKNIIDSGQFGVIYNAVDKKNFQFQNCVREEMRRELNVKDCFVIGHIGGFSYVKNHEFLLRVFQAVRVKCPDAFLLLVGSGNRLDKIKTKVSEKKLEEAICFLGWRNDIPKLVQAMDMFVLPSHFEGLPTVGIEAQSSGLPCVFSDTITKEVAITDRCRFLSLSDEPEVWAEEILKMRKYKEREKIIFTNNANNYDKEEQKKALRKMIFGEKNE